MRNKKAQSSLEYIFLISTVVAALLAMLGLLIFRVMGKYKQAADTISEGEQYEPGVTQVIK
ncbi:MAG: hypothetical protein ISS44_01885 [Candidatus Omnitrophica bacterium]|nr:hypothetical protein [Candidatus Omnitrophota bacterium]